MQQKTLRVAAAQIITTVGETARNLAHMDDMAAQAAAQGARLILSPELAPCGYLVDTAMWAVAEPWGGPSMKRLCAPFGAARPDALAWPGLVGQSGAHVAPDCPVLV